MNILLIGASGFIGKNIFLTLAPEHHVIAAGRKNLENFPNWRKVDFCQENNWDALLRDVDMAINAVGIIEGDFQKIQAEAPVKLIDACIKKNIRVISISALGAEKEKPLTEFLQTKKTADLHLLGYKNGKVIYPGIVIGNGGKSSQLFAALAKLPFVMLPSDNLLSFVHIRQLSQLVCDVVNRFDDFPDQIFAVSEPEPLTAILSAMKGEKVNCVKISEWTLKVLFAIFPKASFGVFNKNTFLLFQKLNASDHKPSFSKVSALIEAGEIQGENIFIPAVALSSIVFIWLWSGISSLVNMDESQKLMRELGAHENISSLAIYAGSFADIFLGFAVSGRRFRKNILLLQMIFILTYTLLLTIFAPHYWLHPFGILSKNIPLLALTYYLYSKRK